MELFVYQGYANTGLAEIAKAAGVLPGSLYYFFPSKEDLLHATLEERKRQLQPEVLTPIFERIDDPIERIFALLAGYRSMLELTDFRHGCPIGNLVIEVGEKHRKTRRLLVENFDNWLQAVAQGVREAAGRLPNTIDPDEFATFVLVVMEGAVVVARAYRNFTAYDAAVTMLRDYVERLVADATTWSVAPPDAAELPAHETAFPKKSNESKVVSRALPKKGSGSDEGSQDRRDRTRRRQRKKGDG